MSLRDLLAARSTPLPHYRIGGKDELAFFRVESGSDADVEIETAIRREMAGFARARLIKISTPYAKGALLFDDYTRYLGHEDGEVLVWQAPTTVMNQPDESMSPRG